MTRTAVLALLVLLASSASRAGHHPVAGSGPLPHGTSISLTELVSPVALYPDELLSVVLAASTFPLQVDQADWFLQRLETDPDLQPEPAWDDSVVALLNYPEVVALMNADLDWTRRLGEAVRMNQPGVIHAVQRFRRQALQAGNLSTDRYQVVSETAGTIEITSVDPSVIHVPYYHPELIVHRSPAPLYHFHPAPRPSYYYRYPDGHHSRFLFLWNVTSVFAINWHGHSLGVHIAAATTDICTGARSTLAGIPVATG